MSEENVTKNNISAAPTGSAMIWNYGPPVNQEMSPTIGTLAKALSAAQGEMENAIKDGKGNYGTHATLASAFAAARPSLSKHGLAVTQPVVFVYGELFLKTILMHSSGEWLASLYPLKPVRNDPQGMGSCVTYAKRYAFQAMIGQASEDDDGQAASNKGERFPFENEPSAPKKPTVKSGGYTGDPADYVVKIGKKYKDKKLRQIPAADIGNFMLWLNDEAHKKNEKLVGFAKEFVEQGEFYLASLEEGENR